MVIAAMGARGRGVISHRRALQRQEALRLGLIHETRARDHLLRAGDRVIARCSKAAPGRMSKSSG